MVVVLASEGYPESYPKGEAITMPEVVPEGSFIVHAGTNLDESGQVVTSGGRVLGVVGTGTILAEASRRAYALCDLIHFDSKYLRRDIGYREFNRG